MLLLSSPRALLLLVALSSSCVSLAFASSAPWPRPAAPSAAALAAWSRYAPSTDAMYSLLPASAGGRSLDLYTASVASAAATPQSDYEDAQQTGSRFAALTRAAARRAVESAGGMSALHYPSAPRVALAPPSPSPSAARSFKTMLHTQHKQTQHQHTQAAQSKLGRSPVEGGVQLPTAAAAGAAAGDASVTDSANSAAASSPRTFSKSSALSFGWIALAAIVTAWPGL